MLLCSSPSSETKIRSHSFTNSSFYAHSQRSIVVVVRSTESALSKNHLLLEADAGHCTILLLLLLLLIVNFTNWTTLSPLDWFSTYLSSYCFLSISSIPLFMWRPPRFGFSSNHLLHLCAPTRPHHSKIQYLFHSLHCYTDDTLLYHSSTSKPIHNCQRLEDLKITWTHNGFMSNKLKNMLE